VVYACVLSTASINIINADKECRTAYAARLLYNEDAASTAA